MAFQFYDSPIKSVILRLVSPAPVVFQFYDSPIKRTERSAEYGYFTIVSIL